MIKIENLHVKEEGFSLKNVCLELEEHKFHVIIGPTGSGKTMLVETILGLRRADSGTIRLNLKDITRLPPEKRNMSYLPQDICLFPTFTVRDNIYYAIKIKKLDRSEYDDFIGHICQVLNIDSLLDRYPKNLSGGEKQRVALARSLAMKPQLLVLDEPFSSIDGVLREEAQRRLKELFLELKITTLMITHDFDEAFFLADNVSIIMDGEIIQTATKEKLYNFPRSLDAAKFLCFRNIYQGTVSSIKEDALFIVWQAMEQPLEVKCSCSRKRFRINDRLYWGVRSENLVLTPCKKDGPNIVTGEIAKIYRRGKRSTLVISLEKGHVIEVDIYNQGAMDSSMKTGDIVSVHIQPDVVFTINIPDQAAGSSLDQIY